MSSNYSINIDIVESHDDSDKRVFRGILTGKKSTFGCFIERTKDYWETGREVPSR